MKRWLVLVTVMSSAVAGWGQNKNPDLKTTTVIRAGVLIDGESNVPRRNQVIVIRGNQIVEVSDAASVHIPAGAEVIDDC